MKQLRDSKAQGSALFTLVSGIVIAIAVIYFSSNWRAAARMQTLPNLPKPPPKPASSP